MSTAAAVHPNHASSPCSSVDSVFSVVTSSTHLPHLPHQPHTAHPIPLREQAFALHCQGLRSPAIAAELGVPERTIRAWLAAALAALKDDLQLSRKEQLLLAVERQHQLTASAWHQFDAEAAARDALLDATLEVILNANDPTTSANTSPRALHLHLPASTPAPRYLSLILQANKETNRLLGLHTLATLHVLTPDVSDSPDIEPPSISPSEIPAESATASSLPVTDSVGASGGRPAARIATSRIPAESATAAESQYAAKTATGSLRAPSCSPWLNPRIPAESATVISPPLVGAARAFVGASGGRPSWSAPQPCIPAKTATAADIGLTAGIVSPPIHNPRFPRHPSVRPGLLAPLSSQGRAGGGVSGRIGNRKRAVDPVENGIPRLSVL